MNFEVLLFSGLREIAGKPKLSIPGDEIHTVSDVWAYLCSEFPQVRSFHTSVIFAVNQEFASLDTPIEAGDEIAIFPPVSGGEDQHAASCQETGNADIFKIVRTPIKIEDLVNELLCPEDGAVVIFDGVVRDNTLGRKTLHLEYQAYEPMALKKMIEIGTEIRRQWSFNRLGIVHRLGRLEIGESSVIIVVTSAHRKIAFQACQYAIDALKKIVPIWKKEFFVDGEVWVEGEFSNP